MKTCKHVLKEIDIYGTDISDEARSHQEECETCTAAFNETAEMERYLLSASETEAPGHLKCAILETAAKKTRPFERSFFPTLGMAIRTLAILIILVSGFWLGLITANGNDTGQSQSNQPEDFDIVRDAAYNVNVSPMSPMNLGEVYFAVLEENENGN